MAASILVVQDGVPILQVEFAYCNKRVVARMHRVADLVPQLVEGVQTRQLLRIPDMLLVVDRAAVAVVLVAFDTDPRWHQWGNRPLLRMAAVLRNFVQTRLRVVAGAMTLRLNRVLAVVRTAAAVVMLPKIVVPRFLCAVLVVLQQEEVTWHPFHRTGP